MCKINSSKFINGITVNALLTAVLDLADQYLVQKRVENDIPEMN